jgi:uncharacterized protein with HEPN domain
MNRSDIDRLRDARSFAEHALYNAGGLSANVLAEAFQPQFGLVVIGQALSKVSSEIKSAAPDLPWKATYNLRNLIVHAYWQIDLENIARIIEAELEPLMERLDNLIAFVERTQK